MSRNRNAHLGWHQIGVVSQFTRPLAGVRVGGRMLLVVQMNDRSYVYEGSCPHRGAQLSLGELVGNDCVRCPFHGYSIRLGGAVSDAFAVRDFRVTEFGDSMFILPSSNCDTGLDAALERLRTSHQVTDVLHYNVATPPEMIIENAFDRRHFQSVHGINGDVGLRLERSLGRELVVGASFRTAASEWQAAMTSGSLCVTHFVARVFSPNICLTELSVGNSSVLVLTAASLDARGNQSSVWISIAWDIRATHGSPLHERSRRSFLEQSKKSFEQDILMWETLDTTIDPRFTADDDLVVVFREWCRQFSN